MRLRREGLELLFSNLILCLIFRRYFPVLLHILSTYLYIFGNTRFSFTNTFYLTSLCQVTHFVLSLPLFSSYPSEDFVSFSLAILPLSVPTYPSSFLLKIFQSQYSILSISSPTISYFLPSFYLILDPTLRITFFPSI